MRGFCAGRASAKQRRSEVAPRMKHLFRLLTATCATLLLTTSALAQSSDRPIRIVLGFAAGDPQGPCLTKMALASFQKTLLTSQAIRVGGGTAEIQRNILAGQVLGLPPDIRVDKAMPFNRITAGRA